MPEDMSGFTDRCLPSAVKSRFLTCLPRFLGSSEDQNQFWHPASDIVTDADLSGSKYRINIKMWLILKGQ